MRIAHLTPSYFSSESVLGGGERYVFYIVQALRAAGATEQTIFVPGAQDSFTEIGGFRTRMLRNDAQSRNAMESFATALWGELSGFDVVHIHQSLTLFGAYSAVIGRSLGLPCVGTDHGGGEEELMLRGGGLEVLSGIVSLSKFAQATIEPFFHGPHRVLIGPVDTNHFSPGNASRERDLVLCVSRIMPHKGIDRVIEALPSGMRLVIAGAVYHQEYYERLRVLGAGKVVKFVHDADDEVLRELYRSATLFVQASTHTDMFGNIVRKPELMGLTTLEAMACGLPVAVSDAGSLPELVTDVRFGRVFANNGELAAILEEVSTGIWPPSEASALARSHAENAHGLTAIGARLLEFYREVAKNPASGV